MPERSSAASEHSKHVDRFMAGVIATLVVVAIIMVVAGIWLKHGPTGVLVAGGIIAAPVAWGVVLWRLTAAPRA